MDREVLGVRNVSLAPSLLAVDTPLTLILVSSVVDASEHLDFLTVDSDKPPDESLLVPLGVFNTFSGNVSS